MAECLAQACYYDTHKPPSSNHPSHCFYFKGVDNNINQDGAFYNIL